jgi:hypothetical protein
MSLIHCQKWMTQHTFMTTVFPAPPLPFRPTASSSSFQFFSYYTYFVCVPRQNLYRQVQKQQGGPGPGHCGRPTRTHETERPTQPQVAQGKQQVEGRNPHQVRPDQLEGAGRGCTGGAPLTNSFLTLAKKIFIFCIPSAHTVILSNLSESRSTRA